MSQSASIMSGDLVVNPYLQIQFFSDLPSEFLFLAPKPGEGLRSTRITSAENANIFEVFADLAKSRFDYLSLELDLTDQDRDVLIDAAVLVDESHVPEKPLFACKLDDTNEYAGELNPAELIVNPSFRFEAFDLTKFADLAQSKNLSPESSSAWIRSTLTGIETGYWLTRDEADPISRFVPGSGLDEPLDQRLLRKLLTAQIVGTRDGFRSIDEEWSAVLRDARTQFAADKYAVLRGIFPASQMSAMRSYYRKYVDEGFMPFGDAQVERRYRQHNEPYASFLHRQFQTLMSKIVGDEVKLSYVYAASYKPGSVLHPHTDREQCEFSISFQVDYQPEQPGQISPWALYVEPIPDTVEPSKHGTSFELDGLERSRVAPPSKVYLSSGDGLIYKGRELVHYRDTLPEGHRSTSLFFHFVSKDFAGDLD